jgi:hypothetical protein
VSDAVRDFVNAAAVDLPAGANVADAVRATDPSLVDSIAGGTAYVTDGRGIEIDASTPLVSGAILRIVVRARARDADADA